MLILISFLINITIQFFNIYKSSKASCVRPVISLILISNKRNEIVKL